MSARLHVVSALLLVALCVLLSARTTTAMTAMEDLILSQRNYSGVSGFFHPSFAVPYANHTLPTPVMLYNATVGTRIQVLSQDPYILTQAHADYLQSTLPDSRTFMSNPVRASMVRGCTAVHAVCCSYYWVTDAYPPGLSLSEIDPSLILWNGTGTSMPINFSYATRFSSVNCSATDDSLIPAALRRPISMYNVPALSRFAMGAPLVWDFFGPDSYGAPLYRLLEIPLALNAGNATVRAFLQQQFAAVVTPIVDPWKVLGEDAMHLTLDTGDNLVATNRSSALGYIPVVAPVVVSAVLIVATVVFVLVTLCVCEQQWRAQLRELSEDSSSSHNGSLEQSMDDRSGFFDADGGVIDVEGTSTASGVNGPRGSSVDPYDMVRKPSFTNTPGSTTPSPALPRGPSAMSLRREGHRRASNLSSNVPTQAMPLQQNPLSARPSMYMPGTVPSRTNSFLYPVADQPGPMMPAQPAQPYPTQPGSQRRVPSVRAPPPPPAGPVYVPPQPTPYVMPHVPFVPTPDTVITPETAEVPPAPPVAPGDAEEVPEGSVSRRGSGLRRKSSMVSWNLKDIEM